MKSIRHLLAAAPVPNRETPAPPQTRRSRIFLAVGAASGIILAASGTLRQSEQGLPRSAIARLNDQIITREQYARRLEALAADKRNELTHDDRVHVLKRIIEEELLVQRGAEIGLVSSDRSVRASIVSSMIQSIVADVASAPPDRAKLEEFYSRNTTFFTRPGRYRVQQIVFRGVEGEGEGPLVRAQHAQKALVGGAPFEVVRERFGDEPIAPLPDALLPVEKLREYLGPTLAQEATELKRGEVTPPLRSSSNVRILRLVEVEHTETVPIDSIMEQIEAEYRRREGEQALRDYLDRLTSEADLVFAEEAPR